MVCISHQAARVDEVMEASEMIGFCLASSGQAPHLDVHCCGASVVLAVGRVSLLPVVQQTSAVVLKY